MLGYLKVFFAAMTLAALGSSVLAQDQKVTVSVASSRAVVAPGDRWPVAVVFDHADGWHIHTNAPKPPKEWDFEPIATTIEIKPTTSVSVGRIQWPKVHTIEVDLTGGGRPRPYGVFEGEAIAFVPLRLDADAKPGKRPVTFTVDFQACNDQQCLAPETIELTLDLEIVATGDPRLAESTINPTRFVGFDAAALSDDATWPNSVAPPPKSASASSPAAREADHIRFSVFGRDFDLNTKGVGFAGILLLGFIGGLLLNVMPCVLPVIPLKIMGLANSAGSRSRLLFLGFMMSLGVIAFWIVIGGIIAASTTFKSAAQLFSYWWVGVGMGAFILVMGLGMLGAFSVGLPDWVYSLNPKQETAFGSFGFGVLTAVLAAPCVAPFGGAALGWAAFQSAPIAMTLFGVIGLGMAIPYFVLAANPGWVSKLPRTGPASDLIKQVLALLMFAVAAFFIGAGLLTLVKEYPFVAPVLYWWIVAVICCLAAAWLIVRTWAITRSGGRRVFFSVLGILLATGGVAWAQRLTTIEKADHVGRVSLTSADGLWAHANDAAINKAISDGKTVVLDFTADWCLNCKTLKALVLNQSRVVSAITQDHVVSFEVDLTARNAPGWVRLRALGEAGVPLLVVYGPGHPQPWKSNLYSVDDVVAAIDTASKTPPQPSRATQIDLPNPSPFDSPNRGG